MIALGRAETPSPRREHEVFNTTAEAKAAALKEQMRRQPRRLTPLARTIIGLDR